MNTLKKFSSSSRSAILIPFVQKKSYWRHANYEVRIPAIGFFGYCLETRDVFDLGVMKKWTQSHSGVLPNNIQGRKLYGFDEYYLNEVASIDFEVVYKH